MKLPRPTSEADRLDLKAATRQALDMARPAKFALITRVDTPALSNYGSPSEPDKFMPIDIVVDLCRDIGAPVLIEEMARQLGFKLVPLEPCEGGDPGIADIAAVSKEAADVVGALAAGLSGDGKLDGAQRRVVRTEISENVTVLRRLERKMGGAA
ncbi:hypothetical protein [Mesorhizobium sp. B2-4-7]|uniref:hypothetical protein n=1 Tax=Mesorhizobium sp. B2-4-7 TaxID=2589942 RepID=UPI00112B7788|nr:hypothetical protein [Mesorhizobium sp. B2-4-7]TPL30204.1 hypothetical protein FJ946_02750 [Mesorhizobium sp. B2-4-7]